MAEEKKTTDVQAKEATKDETIKDGVYEVKSSRGGKLKVMSQDAENYHKDMEAGLAHKPGDRSTYLGILSPEEQKFVQAANEQGKGVRWTNENGHVFTFVPSKEQKEKAAAKEKAEKEAAQGEKKEGSSWWKWLLGGLAVVGLGIGAYFLFRKKDKKSNTTSTTNNTTNSTTNTSTNTNSNTTSNTTTNTNTNTSTNISAPAINTGSSLTDTIAANSGGTVNTGGYEIGIGINRTNVGGRD